VDRKLINYLPPVLREVLELKAINEANEPEISLAWDALAIVLANQFLEEADERGVAVWEKELKIFPKDTDTLELRKARIKAMWNMEIPYTIPWLKNWLTSICGPAGHEETIKDYTISIELDYTVLPEADTLAAEILKMLLAVRPSNMRVLMAAFLQSYGTVTFGAATELAHEVEVYPWIVSNLESTGGVAIGAVTETAHQVEIYPSLVHRLDSNGTLRCGATTEIVNSVEVWPYLVRNLESRGSAVMVGALEYHATVEIYPTEQEEQNA
jgi:hypothetical protein